MRVVDLRAELKKLGLATTGKKKELEERLQQATQSNEGGGNDSGENKEDDTDPGADQGHQHDTSVKGQEKVEEEKDEEEEEKGKAEGGGGGETQITDTVKSTQLEKRKRSDDEEDNGNASRAKSSIELNHSSEVSKKSTEEEAAEVDKESTRRSNSAASDKADGNKGETRDAGPSERTQQQEQPQEKQQQHSRSTAKQTKPKLYNEVYVPEVKVKNRPLPKNGQRYDEFFLFDLEVGLSEPSSNSSISDTRRACIERAKKHVKEMELWKWNSWDVPDTMLEARKKFIKPWILKFADKFEQEVSANDEGETGKPLE